MKRFLKVLMSTVLMMPIAFLLVPSSYNPEAAETTFMDVIKIDRSQDVSNLHLFDDRIITTYRDYADRPALITSYSKTGSLEWEISLAGANAFTADRFARTDGNILYIHSTITGKVLSSVKVAHGASKIYMNEYYIVLATRSSILVYDTAGNFIIQLKPDFYTAAALNKTELVLQDSKGVHLFDLANRKKLWHVPLESGISAERLLMPVNNIIHAQGAESSSVELLPPKDVVVGINATTGAVLYKKRFEWFEETWPQVGKYGLLTRHEIEDKYNFYHVDGSLKMSLSMESEEIKELKRKHGAYTDHFSGAQEFVASNEGIYYFRSYTDSNYRFAFASIKILDNNGAVKFEKVLNEHVFSIATTDTDKLFVANGLALGNNSEMNELSVFDSNGTLLDTIETEYISKLKSDGSRLYGYGGKTLYIFKESESKESISVPRIFGASRFDTAIAISREGWETADTVVLATAADFPDALAGGPLAYKENAPILLTRSERLLLNTKEEIQRLGAKKVIILGSHAALSLEVEKELKAMQLEVERIGGANRFDTAALISQRLASNEAVLASGFNFPDALSVSPYASRTGIPILLTRTDKLPAETAAALKTKTKTHVIGSIGAVGETVFKSLPNPIRYGGNTRYDTGLQVNSRLKMGTGKAYIATGMNFPDALAGSVLAAKNNAPILLVKPDAIPEATLRQLSSYQSFAIFGGQGVVGEPLRERLILQLNK